MNERKASTVMSWAMTLNCPLIYGDTMREFSILYISEDVTWAVIATDQHDDYWFVYQGGITQENTAREIARAMNTYEANKRNS